ncbi:hypothetical protein BGZ57DRAFT_925402 [Hyaloscypha finlandica]|nr:hypothetical protein BGZ57DRAFT_925402 [Hyaloscypha finlandica]
MERVTPDQRIIRSSIQREVFGRQAEIHVYPEVAGKVVPLKTPYPNAVAPNQEQSTSPPAPHRRYCGMSKNSFLIALGAAAIVVVGVVAGAICAALGSRKSSKDMVTSLIRVLVHITATCSSKATGASQAGIPVTAGSLVPTSSTFSSTPLDTTASIGSTAASTAGDPARKVYVHLYHQQGLNIADRARPGKGSFAVAQALPLKTAPKIGTALAASDFLDANSNYAASNNIICANFTNSLGINSLTPTKSTQIAGGTTVHTSSSLALVYLGADGGFLSAVVALEGSPISLSG